MSAMGDIDEIQQVKYRYLRALDTKHWDEFADTLTEDVVGGYGESIGEEHHFTNRDELVEFMRNSLRPEILTEHRVTHPEITVDGDEATGDLVPAGPGDRTGFQLHADRRGVLPRHGTGAPPTAGRSAKPATTAPTTPRCRRRT